MEIEPLPSLDRTSPTFKTDVDTFFATQLPAFSVQAEAARVEILDAKETATEAAEVAISKAGEALTSANNAGTSEGNAQSYRSDALVAKNAAEAALDSFDDRYLGAKAVAPTLDNDGNALLIGAIYFDTAIGSGSWRAWNGGAWVTAPAANASAVINTPAGNIAAMTVQAAINELDTEKAALSGAAFTGDIAAPSLNTGQLAGLRNAVINGNGLVQQRVAPTLTAALKYGAADRHMIGVTGGTGVSGGVSVLANAGFSCGVGYGAIAASWTTGQFIFKHRAEAKDTRRFNSKTVTVSGKLYQDTGGSRNFTVSIGKPTTTADAFSALTNLGTSGAVAVPTGTVTPFRYTLALGATDATLGLELLITDSAANTVVNKNYAVSDLQLEIGSVATEFEHRPHGLELALCQRRFWQSSATTGAGQFPRMSGYNTAGALSTFSYKFPVTMAGTPTVTPLTAGGWALVNTSAPQVASMTTDGFDAFVTPTATGPFDAYPGTGNRGFTAEVEL